MCERYTAHVNSKRIAKWNISRLAKSTALATLVLCASGCGGLGASGSLSPASFLLPGLGHNDSQKTSPINAPDAEEPPASPQFAAIPAELVP